MKRHVPWPAIEAHRGGSANAPENTLAAFKHALALKAPWLELDIHPSRDGALMVMHDDTVDRTTNGSGAVSELNFDALRRLDAGAWFGPQFAGERIPRLEEVLELLVATDTRLNVEIKPFPTQTTVPATLIALLRRFGKERQYVVSSFDLEALLQMRALAPETALALLGDGREILAPALQHRLEWIHPQYQTLEEGIVAQAHAAGIYVNVWTIDNPATLESWRAMGVDKICTNCPAVMLAATDGIARGVLAESEGTRFFGTGKRL